MILRQCTLHALRWAKERLKPQNVRYCAHDPNSHGTLSCIESPREQERRSNTTKKHHKKRQQIFLDFFSLLRFGHISLCQLEEEAIIIIIIIMNRKILVTKAEDNQTNQNATTTTTKIEDEKKILSKQINKQQQQVLAHQYQQHGSTPQSLCISVSSMHWPYISTKQIEYNLFYFYNFVGQQVNEWNNIF